MEYILTAEQVIKIVATSSLLGTLIGLAGGSIMTYLLLRKGKQTNDRQNQKENSRN